MTSSVFINGHTQFISIIFLNIGSHFHAMLFADLGAGSENARAS